MLLEAAWRNLCVGVFSSSFARAVLRLFCPRSHQAAQIWRWRCSGVLLKLRRAVLAPQDLCIGIERELHLLALLFGNR